MNDPVNLDALSDFVGGISDRVPPEDDWGIGFVITGDTAAAGTAHHKGETMDRPEYQRRLEEHREERGAPAGGTEDTIVFNVVESDRKPFEQKRYGPGEERPG
jgi:hypothetical protein